VSAVEPLAWRRTPAKRKARQLATTLRQERPDYVYLKEVFRQLRAEIGIVVPRTPKRLPYVPTEEEVRHYCDTVWKTRKPSDVEEAVQRPRRAPPARALRHSCRALIQPYSGHASRQSLEIYSRLAIADAQAAYADTMGRFPV
jgi:hypothetical protein